MSFQHPDRDLKDIEPDADDPLGHEPHVHPGGGMLPPRVGIDEPGPQTEPLPDEESGPAERPPDDRD